MPDLVHVRQQTLSVRIGLFSAATVLLLLVAGPGLIRAVEAPAEPIPLFQPYRSDAVSLTRPGASFTTASAERSVPTVR